jgi:hypothetical protein
LFGLLGRVAEDRLIESLTLIHWGVLDGRSILSTATPEHHVSQIDRTIFRLGKLANLAMGFGNGGSD